jgi:hypothetical protein
MVLDITRTFFRGLNSAAELAEDGLVGLANNVGEDVETTTMRHTNDDGLNTKIDGAINLHDSTFSIGGPLGLMLQLTMAFIPGIKVSPPSRPKRFSEGYLEATKRSKLSDQVKRSKMTRFSSTEYLKGSGVSMRSRIQSH